MNQEIYELLLETENRRLLDYQNRLNLLNQELDYQLDNYYSHKKIFGYMTESSKEHSNKLIQDLNKRIEWREKLIDETKKSIKSIESKILN